MNNSQKVLMKGNEAIAEAAVRAGCLHYFGYPITPQTEIAAYMAKRLPKIGGTFLQAESELAAVNMVYGAASAGVRAMTSSSSPGISLKSEGISYLAGCDLPALIVNVQRGGPGLGGIQPSQADYWQATRAAGHGDFHLLVFAPARVQECADMVAQAFELADTYRMPAMMLADGLLGQMMEPVLFSEQPSKTFDKESWAACGHKGKRKHNIINSLELDPGRLEQSVIERYERYEEIKRNYQQAELYLVEDAEIVLIAFGAAARITQNAVDAARNKGIRAGMIRPKMLWPFPEKAISEAAKTAKVMLSVEMNMGQMVDDIKLAVKGAVPVHFFGHTGGIIPTPEEIFAQIEQIMKGV